MTWYLYKDKSGMAQLTQLPVIPHAFPDYEFVAEFSDDQKPDIAHKVFDKNGVLVPYDRGPLVVDETARAMPTVQEQLDAVMAELRQGGPFKTPKIREIQARIDAARTKKPQAARAAAGPLIKATGKPMPAPIWKPPPPDPIADSIRYSHTEIFVDTDYPNDGNLTADDFDPDFKG
jgi:hypothetical protein